MLKKRITDTVDASPGHSVLNRPPTWRPPRKRSLRPRDRIRLDFTDDPREGDDEAGDLPPRRPSWRTLRRALRHARGPVVYARQWHWYDALGPPVRGCVTEPVAYLDLSSHRWVTDWAALDRLGLLRTRRGRLLDIGWEEWLSAEHRDLLAVMRLLHGRRAGGESRVGPLAQRLLGERHGLCELVDRAWVLEGRSQDGAHRHSYTAVVGTLTFAKRAGTFDAIEDAEAAAREAIDDARRRLASFLADLGGAAAELAAARARWPKPAVTLVPTAQPVEFPLD